MALFSARTVITSLSLLHITLAFFFLTNPSMIEDQGLVYVIGESMGMPQAGSAFSTPSPANAFLGVLLLVLGLTDLTSLSTPEEVWLLHHWRTQAPLRAFVFALLTLLTWLTSPAGPSDPSRPRTSHARAPWVGANYGTAGAGEALRNRVFFTFAFVEFVVWYWAWSALRQEADALIARKREKAAAATTLD